MQPPRYDVDVVRYATQRAASGPQPPPTSLEKTKKKTRHEPPTNQSYTSIVIVGPGPPSEVIGSWYLLVRANSKQLESARTNKKLCSDLIGRNGEGIGKIQFGDVVEYASYRALSATRCRSRRPVLASLLYGEFVEGELIEVSFAQSCSGK